MQDNVSNNIEASELPPSSPIVGRKKAKLNDGASGDTLIDTITDNINNDLDTVSKDILESSGGNDSGTSISKEFPDESYIVTPSTSAGQALNIKRETQSRNYGKRNAPDRDSDIYSSNLKDSDHLTAEITPSSSREDNASDDEDNTQTEVNNQRQLELSGSTPDGDGGSGSRRGPGENPNEEMLWPRSNEENYSDDGNEHSPPAVLLKERPKHNYFILKEVLNRELGLSFPRGKTTMNDVTFAQRFYSSLHAVFRLEKLHTLLKHNACINCIHFHPEGRLLVSGSDDTNVVVWDWARKIPVHTVNTGHKSNIFQCRFLNLNSSSQLNVVTCGRDGQVRLSQCGSAGGSWARRRLAGHGKTVNKLHVIPLEPHSVLSAGEDGYVLHCDLRNDTVNKVLQLKERNVAIALYSLHGHPFEPNEIVVAGRDKFIRTYDRRNSDKPVAAYSPTLFTESFNIDRMTMRLSTMHLTCAVYNHDGTEILGSYNDDDIYLFNTKTDVYNEGDSSKDKKGYSKRYTGHRNSATLKGVTFYGPKSEYIVSGSDCGHMYIWEKQTESIVQWLQGDANGMVNSVEAHPQFPILASGGMDKDVKIWAPYSDEDPTYQGLSDTIRNNSLMQWQTPLFNDFLPTIYRSWRGENRLVVDDEDLPYYGQIELEANICTTF